MADAEARLYRQRDFGAWPRSIGQPCQARPVLEYTLRHAFSCFVITGGAQRNCGQSLNWGTVRIVQVGSRLPPECTISM